MIGRPGIPIPARGERMERSRRRVSRGACSREFGGPGLVWGLVLFLFAPAACDTCVTGTVSQEGVPLNGVRVELSGDGCPHAYRYTEREGEFCFGGLKASQSCTLSASYGEPLEVPFNTGTNPGKCGSGLCQRVDLTFQCEVQDPLEPNNTCASATPVEVPYSNPLAALCPLGDVDFYRFEVAEEGMVVVAETYYPGTGSSFSSYMGLMDAGCNVLETDSYSGEGNYSRIVYPLPGTGTYIIAVTRIGDYDFEGDHRSTGTYGIDIRLAEPACVNVIAQENGRPLAGARVYPSTGTSCTTDADGNCCFAAAVGEEFCYDVRHPSTHDTLDVCAVPVEPGDCEGGGCAEAVADFDYTCVNGTVTRGGIPVDDVYVYGPYGSEYTGPDGHYCLRAPEENDAQVRVKDPVLCDYHYGVVLTGADGSCIEGGCTGMDFELPDLACVEVTVTRDGDPVEGARVRPQYGCTYSLPTGYDGKACFPAEADDEILVQVEDPAFDEDKYAIVQTGNGGSCQEGGCAQADIALTPSACVSGTVYWGGGEPAADIRVRRPVYSPSYETRSDEDGRYCIAVAQGEEIGLRFYDPAYATDRTRYIAADAGGTCGQGGCEALDVVFPPTSCVSGTVTRADGQPPMGVSVCLGYSGENCVEPAQDGSFCLRAPVDDQALVRVDDNVTGFQQSEYVETGEAGTCSEGACTEVNYELPGVACVKGIVTRDGGSGGPDLPEEGVQVCLGYYEDVCTVTGPAGEYCLPAPADSSARVQATDPVLGETRYSYVDTSAGGSCETGNCVSLDFQLRAATCISGVVREGTDPLEGAEVSDTFTAVLTDHEGRYCVPALADQATFWIEARHPTDGSYIYRYLDTGIGGSCNEGGCTTQDFTFDE